MELTEEALQQSAASPGQDGADPESRMGAHGTIGGSGVGSGPYHDSPSHTPDNQANEDVEMTDQAQGIPRESGSATGETAGEYFAYEDGEEDAEGEVDDDYEFMDAQAPHSTEHHDLAGSPPLEALEEHTDDDEEGVGAVKLRPGDTDEEDDGSEASAATPPEADSEGDAEWEEDDEAVVENDDDESDNAQSNNCMFCKEDEENDPSEEFEAYLTCAGCGENCRWRPCSGMFLGVMGC